MCAQFVMDSPVGRLAIKTDAGKLIEVEYGVRQQVTQTLADPFHQRIKQQIDAYFAQPTRQFSLPLALRGTPFQQKVWAALLNIPVSQTVSYGELASRLHTSARAIGNACRANPVPLVVPCHRVVAKNGIGGFSGATHGKQIDRKRWLLQHEGAV